MQQLPCLPLTDGTSQMLLHDIITLKSPIATESLDTTDNTAEISAVVPPLSALLHRVNGLLMQWPDNAVLLTIVRVCLRILSLPLRSSLSRVLAGIELLLLKCQDWETNASKAVSLQPGM